MCPLRKNCSTDSPSRRQNRLPAPLQVSGRCPASSCEPASIRSCENMPGAATKRPSARPASMRQPCDRRFRIGRPTKPHRDAMIFRQMALEFDKFFKPLAQACHAFVGAASDDDHAPGNDALDCGGNPCLVLARDAVRSARARRHSLSPPDAAPPHSRWPAGPNNRVESPGPAGVTAPKCRRQIKPRLRADEDAGFARPGGWRRRPSRTDGTAFLGFHGSCQFTGAHPRRIENGRGPKAAPVVSS